VAKPELGTKRACPETGRKFYDLMRDPIVSPYTGREYPLSFFEEGTDDKASPEKAVEATSEADEDEDDSADGPEIVSLDAMKDEEDSGDDDADEEVVAAIPDIDTEDDDEIDNSDEDVFLDDEDEDGDVSDIIVGDVEKDEDS